MGKRGKEVKLGDYTEGEIGLLYRLAKTIHKLRKGGINTRDKKLQNWIEDCIEELKR